VFYRVPVPPVLGGSGQVLPGQGTKADLTGEATIAPITAQASTQAVIKTLVFVWKESAIAV